MTDTTPAVYALHENDAWWPPFADAFARAGVPVVDWHLVDGELDIDTPPPPGVFWSRISASSHTRGHDLSKEYARSVLSWLEGHGSTTVNGRRAIELEMSKVHQLARLRSHGIDVPRTVAVIGPPNPSTIERLRSAARRLPTPFITKHNQGGKGLGVRRFDSHAEFDDAIAETASLCQGSHEEPTWPVDGVTLLQEYLRPDSGHITRAEFVGDRYLYALQADTVHGGFQLCPADACAIDPESGLPLIPPGAEAAPVPGTSIFSLRAGFDHPIVQSYRSFLDAEGIGIAGIEFIETADGRLVTYDVNTNTNYNPEVEARVTAEGGIGGPDAIARYLGRLLG